MPNARRILIADASDPRIAPYRAIGNPLGLQRDHLFVAEGRFIVERLLALPRIRMHSVAVTPAGADAMAQALEAAPDIPVLVCEPPVLEAVTGFNFHRGCLALAYRPDTVRSLAPFSSASRLLALEGVGNPDNVGGLFRVALALGAGGVVLDRTTADPLYRKAVRTSMAASLRVPFARIEPWPSALDELKTRGFQIVALTPDPSAPSIDEWPIEPGSRLVLALGSEGAGLDALTMRYADVRLRIPIDPRADSLNVVVAAAMALHALRSRTVWPESNSPKG